MKQLILYFFIFSCCLACGTNKQTNDNSMSCKTNGTVKDYTGLDGCGLLIELENGDKLEPMEVADDFELKDGQKIAFDYEEVEDVASICMVGKIVRITCIKAV